MGRVVLPTGSVVLEDNVIADVVAEVGADAAKPAIEPRSRGILAVSVEELPEHARAVARTVVSDTGSVLPGLHQARIPGTVGEHPGRSRGDWPVRRRRGRGSSRRAAAILVGEPGAMGRPGS